MSTEGGARADAAKRAVCLANFQDNPGGYPQTSKSPFRVKLYWMRIHVLLAMAASAHALVTRLVLTASPHDVAIHSALRMRAEPPLRPLSLLKDLTLGVPTITGSARSLKGEQAKPTKFCKYDAIREQLAAS